MGHTTRTMDQEDAGTRETDKQVELLNPNLTDEEENDYEEIDDEKRDNLEALPDGSSKDNNEGTNSNEVNESDDDDDDVALKVEGSYDPSEYESLEVDAETRSLFSVIMKYTPQTVELDHKFRPFIPDFIPAVGDIDAFIRSTRPDNKDEVLGLKVLDEPSAKQSDPNVLELHMRVVSKQSSSKARRIKKVVGQDVASMEKWIRDISDLHRSKPAPTVHYH